MKTINIELYTAKELKEKAPGSFESALKRYREKYVERDFSDFTGSDILASIKGAFNAAGITLKDYSLGAYHHGFIKAKFPRDYDGFNDPGDLRGPRAMAWLENNLLGPCRVSYFDKKKRAEYRKYGRYYYAGEVEPCPFTGVCYDDDIIDRLIKDIKDKGETLRAAFEGLADYYREEMESEMEETSKPENFIDHADANGLEFLETGEIWEG